MCRWLAYSGAPIFLDEVLFKTDHSLIDQSLRAFDKTSTTNGDGFGIGWYGVRDVPGVYKDIRPAWNDTNLQALAVQIESPMFLAHVRTSTGSPVQRTNCHPFSYQKWLFVHNGLIADYEKMRRELTLAVSPALFPLLSGTTDSELMFIMESNLPLLADQSVLFQSANDSRCLIDIRRVIAVTVELTLVLCFRRHSPHGFLGLNREKIRP